MGVLGRLVKPPAAPAGSTWTAGCPLPRLLCIVVQLPYQVNPSDDDHGCSIVTIHEIREETLQALQQDTPPAHIRLLRDFVCAGQTDLPQSQGKTNSAGLFKAIAQVGNFDELTLPWLLKRPVKSYNGKPCLITKSGTTFKGPRNEWLEVDVDVRDFNTFARNMLYQLREHLKEASIHCGFTIQGCTPEELPEGIVTDIWLHNIDIVENPTIITDL